MTDLLDRSTAASATADQAPAVAQPSPATRHAISAASRLTSSTLCAAAGVIHLVMAPSHFDLSVAEGFLFATAGWVQLALAALLALRPTRAVLVGSIAVNVGLVVAWGFSRIWGLPFGAHAWHPEVAGFVDLTAVGFEVALVLAAVLVLLHPRVAHPRARSGSSDADLVLASIVPAAVVVLTTAVLASPGALDHAHGSHGDHASSGAGTETTAADHDHGEATAGHGHDEGAVDDKGFSLLTNGHQHESGVVELTNEQAAGLAAQLASTAVLVQRYPTLADAEAAGYRRAGPFSPGLGTHFMPPLGQIVPLSPDGIIDTPEEIGSALLIYDGTGPDAPIAGFMFMAYGFTDAPEGFIGPNDHWHYHTNTCVVFNADGTIDAPLGADRSATQAQCDRYGGRLIENTGYMVHVWSVPGYENPRGTFAEVSPALTCPDGTYYTIDTEDGDIGTVATLCRS